MALTQISSHIGDFFARYPQFDYDETNEVWSEYHRMVKKLGWSKQSKKEKNAKAVLHRALVYEFSTLFGSDENKLASLQRLCVKLDIHPVPSSIKACKKAIRRVHVNIVDFIDSERTGKPVHQFRNVAELREYTQETKKIFPIWEAKGNTLVRCLLRQIR